jgi:glutathione S-transferase
MKLFWSSRSPFVRKVMVAAHEAGLADRIERMRAVVAPAKPNAEVMAVNPLNKLPTLVIEDGQTLYDSRVICEYLDGLSSGPKLFPAIGPERIAALRRQALGDGIMDFLLIWLSERNHPAEQQSPPLIEACRLKLRTALDALEAEADALTAAPFGIGHIAIGCALGYADFRFGAEGWRQSRPRLAAWHETIAARASFKATEHADVY